MVLAPPRLYLIKSCMRRAALQAPALAGQPGSRSSRSSPPRTPTRPQRHLLTHVMTTTPPRLPLAQQCSVGWLVGWLGDLGKLTAGSDAGVAPPPPSWRARRSRANRSTCKAWWWWARGPTQWRPATRVLGPSLLSYKQNKQNNPAERLPFDALQSTASNSKTRKVVQLNRRSDSLAAYGL